MRKFAGLFFVCVALIAAGCSGDETSSVEEESRVVIGTNDGTSTEDSEAVSADENGAEVAAPASPRVGDLLTDSDEDEQENLSLGGFSKKRGTSTYDKLPESGKASVAASVTDSNVRIADTIRKVTPSTQATTTTTTTQRIVPVTTRPLVTQTQTTTTVRPTTTARPTTTRAQTTTTRRATTTTARPTTTRAQTTTTRRVTTTTATPTTSHDRVRITNIRTNPGVSTVGITIAGACHPGVEISFALSTSPQLLTERAGGNGTTTCTHLAYFTHFTTMNIACGCLSEYKLTATARDLTHGDTHTYSLNTTLR